MLSRQNQLEAAFADDLAVDLNFYAMGAGVVGAGGDGADGMAFADGERLLWGENGRFQLKYLATCLPIGLHKVNNEINHQILLGNGRALQRKVQL